MVQQSSPDTEWDPSHANQYSTGMQRQICETQNLKNGGKKYIFN